MSERAIVKQLSLIAFNGTMSVFYDTRKAIGQAGAIDYSRMTGGAGAKYSDHEKGVGMINFCQDVVNVAKNTLLPEEFALFRVTYLEREDALNEVHTVQLVNLQNVLGRRFREHRIYPMQEYISR
jgi:hypothetical protein